SPDRMLVHTKQANQLLGESRRIVRDMDTRLTRTGNSAHSYLRCDDRHAITRRLEYLDALAAAGENGVDRHPRPAIERLEPFRGNASLGMNARSRRAGGRNRARDMEARIRATCHDEWPDPGHEPLQSMRA